MLKVFVVFFPFFFIFGASSLKWSPHPPLGSRIPAFRLATSFSSTSFFNFFSFVRLATERKVGKEAIQKQVILSLSCTSTAYLFFFSLSLCTRYRRFFCSVFWVYQARKEKGGIMFIKLSMHCCVLVLFFSHLFFYFSFFVTSLYYQLVLGSLTVFFFCALFLLFFYPFLYP